MEKEKLFQELQKELSSKKESLGKEIQIHKAENEEMKKYITKVEKEHHQPHTVHMKDISVSFETPLFYFHFPYLVFSTSDYR